MKTDTLTQLSARIRSQIISATTAAGSGHPTSSLSATDLITVLMFDGFYRFDLENPDYHNNDRLIFSKGHAAPLLYAAYAAAGKVTNEELHNLRSFKSPLEGHPTLEFPYTEVATGSLGQGLSVGVGMALNAKYLDKLPYNTFVLLGDSELSEGSNWEAMALASQYNLSNLIGILDVNRLGQRGETMHGHNVKVYKDKCEAFGWKVIVIDGHSMKDIQKAYKKALSSDRPTMIVAKTLKGKGVSFIENTDNWHGKALSEEESKKALSEFGDVDLTVTGTVASPERRDPSALKSPDTIPSIAWSDIETMATRKAYGHALQEVLQQQTNVVVLDAETSNSTFAAMGRDVADDRFFEMYIAEQNMAGVALGLSRRGKVAFTSTFAAFWSRAHDQIRMSQYSGGNVKFVGSHAGISIGADGSSQMALEDLSLFRSIHDSVVLYPSDAISTRALVHAAYKHTGNVFIRTTRAATKLNYDTDTEFTIGGSGTLKKSDDDNVTLIGAGITVHECMKAYDILKKKGISARVIDMYSVKPLDIETLISAAADTDRVVVVEDHYPEGGLGEAVTHALAEHETPVSTLSVQKLPRSGSTEELLKYAEIDAEAIVSLVDKHISL
ncbi:MAG: transketolase [Patescibacteria group bacterium]